MAVVMVRLLAHNTGNLHCRGVVRKNVKLLRARQNMVRSVCSWGQCVYAYGLPRE